MPISNYNREDAIQYAHKWAFTRNSNFANFDGLGGDCTNFVSQCIYAGSKIMNYKPLNGWFFINLNHRTPSWSGVDFLHEFLINNKGAGPYATECSISQLQIGDIIQLSFHFEGPFNHSLVVVKTGILPSFENILVTTHTFDSNNRPLLGYNWSRIRFIHIEGIRIR